MANEFRHARFANPVTRLRCPVQFDIALPAVSGVVAMIKRRAHEGRSPSGQRLRAHVSDSGHLRIAMGGGSRNPPVRFRGRLEPGGRGVVVNGTIREPADSITFGAAYSLLSVVMTILAVYAGLGGSVYPACFCAAIALIFGVPVILGIKNRPVAFDKDCQKAMDVLRWLMPPGTGE